MFLRNFGICLRVHKISQPRKITSPAIYEITVILFAQDTAAVESKYYVHFISFTICDSNRNLENGGAKYIRDVDRYNLQAHGIISQRQHVKCVRYRCWFHCVFQANGCYVDRHLKCLIGPIISIVMTAVSRRTRTLWIVNVCDKHQRREMKER
jgi:hypothetical protein